MGCQGRDAKDKYHDARPLITQDKDSYPFFSTNTSNTGRRVNRLSSVNQFLVDHTLGSPVSPVRKINIWKILAGDSGIPVEKKTRI